VSLAALYPYIKHAHIGLALASGALFAVRGLAVLAGGRWAMRSPVRHASMGIDTLLLVAALLLLFILQLNPFAVAWLRVKLMLLVAYIVLGTFALKRARGTGARALCFAAALACFLMMYSVARTHNPLGWLG
jgi:uncharacterized membrane protein SirB2